MNYEDLLSLAKGRRSCRRFLPDPVSDELVQKIIEVARWAPSGANSQPWDFIVVKKKELRKKISQFHREFLSIYYKLEHTRGEEIRFPSVSKPVDKVGWEDAPVFIFLCGDTRTKQAYPLYASVEISDAILESSLANAFLYMHLAASSLGLGSQWVSGIRMWYIQCQVKDLLQIPDECVIYDMFVTGHPASKSIQRLVRNTEEMEHEDYFDKEKFRTADEVRDFISSVRKGRTYSEMGSKRSDRG